MQMPVIPISPSKNTEADGLYEGREPYAFISYSHKDRNALNEVLSFFRRYHMRCWYDSGLHSGDDWNLIIARHLEGASVCLLLLSENSASSEYVRNELNFALNHRIPIHILLLEDFPLPIDVEIMIGRIQQIRLQAGYEQELIRALPPELVISDRNREQEAGQSYEHPLYETGAQLLERQGTVSCQGLHRILRYPVLIQQDIIRNSDSKTVLQNASAVSTFSHPLFLPLLDIHTDHEYMYSYLGSCRPVFLDEYLGTHQPDEKTVEKWMNEVIDGLEYLFRKGYVLNELARGSVIIDGEQDIRVLRLHHPYYGIFRYRTENRQYYLENEIQECAALLYQLCTGSLPILPIRMIREKDVRLSGSFIKKANLIIQKAAKEKGRSGYQSLAEMKEDLQSGRISLKDQLFLNQREKKLEQYQKAKDENRQRFTATDAAAAASSPYLRTTSLEEEFGFDATVSVVDDERPSREGDAQIRLVICGSGQPLEFAKNSITIGRDKSCDAVFSQVTISRRHVQISKKPDGTYELTDLRSANGVFIDGVKVPAGATVPLTAENIFRIVDIEFRLLP